MRRLYKILLPLSLFAFSTGLNAKSIKHTVKRGESLYTIAHKNHISIDELRKVNHLKKGEILKIGKVLTIPSKKKAKLASKRQRTKIKKYTIKKGDNLTLIARKHHTTISKLIELNHLSQNKVLKVGKVIKVPFKYSTKKYAKTKKSSHKLSKVLHKRVSKFAINDIVFTSRYKTDKAKKIIKIAKKKLGKRYVWGASGSNAFDCSGFTTYVCKLNGIKLPRRAIAQSKVGKYVPRSQLKPGDLIFFDTSKHRRGYVNHVGIYIGNDKFIHASSAKHKVIITSLKKPFYSQRFKVARRVAL